MAKTKMGQCALCYSTKELQLSHVVPHFVGRKLFKTSAGSIRNSDEPNMAVQDIEKHFMLCHDCEELFSAKEKWFSANIFNPFQNNRQETYNYNENLAYFIVSLSWRSLYLDLEEFSTDPNFDKELLMTLFRSEQIMRDYLLNRRNDIGTIENHIFFLDRIESVENLDVSKHPSVAMHRTISSYTCYNGKTLFTVSNLMGIMIVTFYAKDDKEQWVNTKIEIGEGIIEARNQKMVSVVGQEIPFWMEQSEESQNRLSEKQKQKSLQKMKDVGDKIKDYPIYQDWLDDAALKNE